MKYVTPQVFAVAETRLLPGTYDALVAIGAKDWKRQGEASDAERLIEIGGRLCYNSFGVDADLNRNITKVREGTKDYVKNIIKQRHGAVVEHATVTFIFVNVSRVLTHELVRHRPGMAYCLAGDVEVYSGSKVNGRWDGVGRKWTMKELYEKSLTPHGRSRLKLCLVRVFNGEKFVSARIRSVSQSGEKDLVRVELANGKYITCSEDHRFLSQGGWAPVRDLRVGSEMACNGVLGYKHTDEAKEKIRQGKMGSNNPMWKGDEASQQAGRLRAYKAFSPDICARCNTIEKLHRHHRDKNTLNNDPSNLEFLCATCHQHEHNLGVEMTAQWSKIVSISPAARGMTYDLEVDHPEHNFVANGIVTHNSQTSGRYVRVTELTMTECMEHLGPGVMQDLIDSTPSFDDAGNGRMAMAMSRSVEDTLTKLAEQIEMAMVHATRALQLDHSTDFGVKKKITSALRRFMPNGQANNIMVTANHRALRHLITMRTSRHAEAEIRQIFGEVFAYLQAAHPAIYADAMINKVGGHCEITFTHGE